MCDHITRSGSLLKTACFSVKLCGDFFFSSPRTLSNWVYELDKWSPSVVKVAYKVKVRFLCDSLFPPLWLLLSKLSLCLSRGRGPLCCAVGLCLNFAVGSSTSCWPLMNTSSRTRTYWPRWSRSKLFSSLQFLACTLSAMFSLRTHANPHCPTPITDIPSFIYLHFLKRFIYSFSYLWLNDWHFIRKVPEILWKSLYCRIQGDGDNRTST